MQRLTDVHRYSRCSDTYCFCGIHQQKPNTGYLTSVTTQVLPSYRIQILQFYYYIPPSTYATCTVPVVPFNHFLSLHYMVYVSHYLILLDPISLKIKKLQKLYSSALHNSFHSPVTSSCVDQNIFLSTLVFILPTHTIKNTNIT